ncbi:Cna protein B-type domain protein [Planctomycetes bacterium Poly30]|uniref:Cna protein B-type domain protein n=1 Tax=Saltatorellus ferox TaxID=2528018 RepID=A0A518ER61_9BACT|nr:Cna protein B-type domain protein [Planctomycetes bacterium Poly30]
MKPKFLALLAVCAALVIGAIRFLPQSNSSSGSEVGVMNSEEEAGDEPGGPGGLDGRLSVSTDGESRKTLVAGTKSELAETAETLLPDSSISSTITAFIRWPDGVTPTEDLVVYAFAAQVASATVQAALSSDTSSVTYERHENRLFEGMESRRGIKSDNVLDEALAKGQVSRRKATPGTTREGTEWAAEFPFPRGRQRVFLHAFGGGYGTTRSYEVLLDDPTVTLEPLQRATVTLRASTEVPGALLTGALVRAELEVNASGTMGAGSDRETRYQAERALDVEGTATFIGVPPESALKLIVLHDTLPPAEVKFTAPAAGESMEISLPITRGSTLSGRVLDAEGRSVAGAAVTAALPGRTFGMDDEVFREVLSGPDGAFRLSGLPAPAVIVRASKEGALQSGRARIEIDGAADSDDLTLVLESGKSIEGVAKFADGKPARGLIVQATFDLAHMGGPSALGAARGATNETTVRDDGSFTVTGLGSGPFMLTISTGPPIGTPSPASEAGVRKARLDGVQPGQDNVELILLPAARITGLCVDDVGMPVRDRKLTCHRIVPGSLGDVRLDRRQAQTDDEGAFAFEGLVSGTWGISLVSETHVTPQEVRVVVRGEEEDLEIVALRSCTISGTVVDPDGNPASGVRVGQFSDEPVWRAALSGTSFPEPTTSQEDGTYKLLGVVPGQVKLQATSNEFAPAVTEELTAAPGGLLEGVTLRMSRGGTIEGVCFDSEGKTASGRLVTIQSMSMDLMRTLSTDADGTFRQTGLTPGRYQVVAIDMEMDSSKDADASGFASMMENMEMAMATVEEGATEYLFLGAPPSSPVEVTGQITRAGEPVSGAMVAFMPASTGFFEKMKIATSGADGQFTLTLDDAGDYMVQVSKVDAGGTGQQKTSEFSTKIPLGTEEAKRDFEVPGGAIAGRVTLPDGKPAAGVRLTVSGSGAIRTDRLMGGSYAETLTRADGSYEVEGIGPGTYQVMAGGAMPMNDSVTTTARVISREITVGENNRVDDVDLELEEPGEALVTVREAGGTPAAGCSLFLRDDKGRHTELISMIVTNSSGKATLQGIAPGRYSVAARAETTASQESPFFEVRSGERTPVELLLEPGGVFIATLKVKGSDEAPVANVQVLDDQGFDVTRRMGMVDMRSKNSDRAVGLYERRVGPLAPGRYTLLATTAEGLTARRRVDLEAGEEKTVTLLLK